MTARLVARLPGLLRLAILALASMAFAAEAHAQGPMPPVVCAPSGVPAQNPLHPVSVVVLQYWSDHSFVGMPDNAFVDRSQLEHARYFLVKARGVTGEGRAWGHISTSIFLESTWSGPGLAESECTVGQLKSEMLADPDLRVCPDRCALWKEPVADYVVIAIPASEDVCDAPVVGFLACKFPKFTINTLLFQPNGLQDLLGLLPSYDEGVVLRVTTDQAGASLVYGGASQDLTIDGNSYGDNLVIDPRHDAGLTVQKAGEIGCSDNPGTLAQRFWPPVPLSTEAQEKDPELSCTLLPADLKAVASQL